MAIYIFLYIFLFFCIFIKKNLGLYSLIYIMLLLIGGLRSMEVGTDTANYYDMYNIITEDPDGLNYILGFVEPGWVFINYLCGYFGGDYRYIVFIGVFLAMTPFFIRVWKSYKNPFAAIFFYLALYFYYNSFNTTRQMISISIIIFSLYYLELGKNKKFYLGVFIAIMFHYSSGICFMFPFLMKKIRLSIWGVSTALVLTYIGGIFIIPKILQALPYIGRYSVYLMDGEGSGSITRLLLNVFFIFIFATSKNSKLKKYLTLFFVGIVAYNLSAFSTALGRIALYFMCTQFLIFTTIDSTYKLNSYLLKLSTFVYATFYYFTLLNANSGEIVPYAIWK